MKTDKEVEDDLQKAEAWEEDTTPITRCLWPLLILTLIAGALVAFSILASCKEW